MDFGLAIIEGHKANRAKISGLLATSLLKYYPVVASIQRLIYIIVE
jgi:hypothetical protein